MGLLITQLSILFLAMIFQIVAEVRDQAKAKTKSRLRVAAISLLVIIFIGTSIYTYKEWVGNQKADKEKREQFNNTVQPTFDTLKSAKKSISHILDSIKIQLEIQKENNQLSRRLTEENIKILASQKAINKNTQQLLNPIFPLTIHMSIEIPFQDGLLDPVNKYVSKLLTEYNDNPGLVKPNVEVIRSFLKDRIEGFAFEDINAFYQEIRKSEPQYWEPLFSFPARISFTKDLKSIESENLSIPHINFLAWNGNQEEERELRVYFDKKIYYLILYNTNLESSNMRKGSNVNMSFSDLIGYYFAVQLTSGLKYKLSQISFSPNIGLQQTYEIHFAENEVIDAPGKTYARRLSKKDLQD